MNRLFWLFSGAVLTVILVSLLGFASAHFNGSQSANSSTVESVSEAETGCPMHSSGMESMHNGMHGSMACMGMSIEEMDKDNDGLCDYCGMQIEECKEMAEMHEDGDMHSGMHSGMMHMSNMHN